MNHGEHGGGEREMGTAKYTNQDEKRKNKKNRKEAKGAKKRRPFVKLFPNSYQVFLLSFRSFFVYFVCFAVSTLLMSFPSSLPVFPVFSVVDFAPPVSQSKPAWMSSKVLPVQPCVP